MRNNANIRYVLSVISLAFLLFAMYVFATSDKLNERVMWLLIGVGVMAVTWYLQETYFPKAKKAYRPHWLERIYAGGFIISAIGAILMMAGVPYGKYVIFSGIGLSISYFIISLYFNIFPPEKPHNPEVLDDDF